MWLVAVVLRRDIDFLIPLIPTPLVYVPGLYCNYILCIKIFTVLLCN